MSKELEAFIKHCPITPSENNFKYWSDYQIALKKYERELQTFTKTFELLKNALTELEDLREKNEIGDKTIIYLQGLIDELNISDTSKEESSIFYYNEMRKYKKELEELKRDVKILNDSIEFSFDDFIWKTEMGMAIKRLINVGKTQKVGEKE